MQPTDEAVEAAACAIYEGPDQYGRPSSVTWQEMLTYGGEFPDNTDHPIADNYREMARLALAAAYAIDEPRIRANQTRQMVEWLRGRTDFSTSDGDADACQTVAALIDRQFATPR